MCHALLQAPKFFLLLFQIDQDEAAKTHAGHCQWCGGVLHRANYPRKPRGCPIEVRADYESRFSFCCKTCRRRTTSMSVRFLGRRVYLALIVVLASVRHDKPTPAVARASALLNVPALTLQRWRQWWAQQFPLTPLWQAACARFMPPVPTELFPASLLERFIGDAEEALMRLLVFLTPISVVHPITLQGGH